LSHKGIVSITKEDRQEQQPNKQLHTEVIVQLYFAYPLCRISNTAVIRNLLAEYNFAYLTIKYHH